MYSIEQLHLSTLAMSHPINIASYTLSSAAGAGLHAMQATVAGGLATLTANDYPDANLECWVGKVNGAQQHQIPDAYSAFDSRNNRLLDYAMQQDGFSDEVANVLQKIRPHRVAVIMGSSTASMAASENAYGVTANANESIAASELAGAPTALHSPHAPGKYVAQRLGIKGPAITVSTACSSSAKSFAMASRWLQSNVVDAVIVGGSDSLSLGTLYGFASLNLLSKNPCRPFDTNRDGISVGEAAGFALLTRASDSSHFATTELCLTGYGESSDAHHMSHPHPEALGAITAMQQAMNSSQCAADDIGYINLHGTATPTNDVIETQALKVVARKGTLASSTKGWTGHTLGAAGITGAVFALEALRTGTVPGTYNLIDHDDQLAFSVTKDTQQKKINTAMVNTFGFGGSNCSLMFGRMS